ncbi:MAG: flagellin, partial [Pseudolabrys sp.]
MTVGATLNGAGGAPLSSVLGLTTGATAPSGNTTRSSYATQFNAVLTQIDALASDASFNGTNLLTCGSLSATFNGSGSSSYSVTGVNATSSGLGFSNVTGGFQLDSEINAALTKVNNAPTSLQNIANSFITADTVLSVRKDFTN